MENVIKKQAVDIVESREGEKHNDGIQRLQIIGIIVFMMVTAPLLCLMGAPILAAHQQYESIARVHGKEAVQIKIPVISAVFGVYEFANANQDVGIGYKRHVVRKEKVGQGQPILLAIG